MTSKLQKKRLYIALSILLSYLLAVDTYAQAPTINLPQANINAQTDFLTSNFPSGNFPAVGLLTAATLSSNSAGFVASNPSGIAALPLSILRYKVNTVNGITQAGEPTVTLSAAAQTIHFITLNVGTVAVTSDYTISTAGTAWQAGTYAANLVYQNLNPTPATLTVVVPGYITANTAPPALTALTVASLAAFRTGGGVSASQNFDYFTTVPSTVQVQANQASFTFATTQQFTAPAPTVAATFLTVTPTGTPAGAPVSLSNSTNKTISVTSGIPVVLTNKIAFSNTLSISNTDLKAQFAQAGTYTIPFTYTVAKTTAYAIAATGYTATSSAQLTVPKLSELTIPGSTTASFNFNTAASYNQGLTAVVSNPITLSSTVPYNVTVKASGNFINGANTIPVGVAILEKSPAETGAVTSIVLSATPQTIISNSSPVIDRAVHLQFRIPSTQTSNLLAKPPGTYSNTVTFTIVAP